MPEDFAVFLFLIFLTPRYAVIRDTEERA